MDFKSKDIVFLVITHRVSRVSNKLKGLIYERAYSKSMWVIRGNFCADYNTKKLLTSVAVRVPQILYLLPAH